VGQYAVIESSPEVVDLRLLAIGSLIEGAALPIKRLYEKVAAQKSGLDPHTARKYAGDLAAG